MGEFRISLGVARQGDGSYRVEESKHGIAVIGSIPVADVVALSKVWMRKGYKIADSLIAQKLGASVVVTSKKGSAAWRKELNLVTEKDG